MVDGMSRWLGIKGDEDELYLRQQQYNYTKAMATMGKRNKNQLTSGQAANLAALEDDSDVDDDFDADKKGNMTRFLNPRVMV